MDGLKGMQGNFWRIGNVCSLDRADGFTLMCIYKKLIKLYFLNMCHVYQSYLNKLLKKTKNPQQYLILLTEIVCHMSDENN